MKASGIAYLVPPTPATNWALFLDLDGTLVDIAPRPDMVSVPTGLGALLLDLAKALGGAVALVSGRTLGDLGRLLAAWRGPAAAEHGAVLRLPLGAVESAPGLPAVPASWRAAVDALARANPGLVVEQKSAGIAVHFRLAPEAAGAVRAAAARLAGASGGAFAAVPGHYLVEIRPCAVDKGWAVRRLMQEPPFAGRIPVFVGDDVTDEDGFRAALSLGGHGLHVHRYFPGGAAGVRKWLVEIPRELRARSSA
jgi:trehalose 6-phosphate phosphatase